jgi:hypothetical protein
MENPRGSGKDKYVSACDFKSLPVLFLLTNNQMLGTEMPIHLSGFCFRSF